MHLLIPFASALSQTASQVLRDVPLPNLARLLGRLTLTRRDDADVYSLSAPHERALAAAFGWQGADGCLPFAAHAAAEDGIEIASVNQLDELDVLGWGLITPTHWHVGRDHVTLTDPAALNLSEDESRAAFQLVSELFESEGFRFEWGAPMRWYVAHPSLNGLPCASLDRVIGRNVERWMRPDADPKSPSNLIRRLQSEWQMLLYPHALNEAREARGELTLNSFWLSGCGTAQAVHGTPPQVDESLRAPLLAEDWAAWTDAWRALDQGAIAACLAASVAGESVALTLCGDRGAHRFESVSQRLLKRVMQRWQTHEPQRVLEAL